MAGLAPAHGTTPRGSAFEREPMGSITMTWRCSAPGWVWLGILLGLIWSRSPAFGRQPTRIAIKGGCYRMGSFKNYADERPAHKVCLDPYAIDRTEVTMNAYARCVAARRCTPPIAYQKGHPTRRHCNWLRRGRGLHPINCVTWKQAKGYCTWVGGHLPTEAQWERAARLGQKRRIPAPCTTAAGAKADGSRRPGCGTGDTAPVESRPWDRTVLGLHDLAGNVSEWSADWFSLSHYDYRRATNPKGPKRGRARTVRGCSFRCVPGSRLWRPSARQFSATWSPTIGFRCAGRTP